MRLVCPQNQLASNLSLVGRAVASRPTHPVLANIMLKADDKNQTVELTAFDLNLGIRVNFAATVTEPGSITLPARLFSDIVSRLPDEDVTLTLEAGEAMAAIACGSGRYHVNGLPIEEFPDLPTIDDGETTYLPIEALISGLDASLFAAATDETKRVLTGVHLTANAESLEFAATDGHRLSVVNAELQDADSPTPFADSLEVTIPARALRELEKMLGLQTEGAIAIKFDQTQMIFQGASQTLTSRLLDGNYPNYRQLVPTSFERQISLDRKAFIAALERIAVLADQKNNIVKLSIDSTGQEIAISVDAPDVATGRESIPAQISGDDLDIAFNVKYLLDGLKAIDSSDIQIQLNTATSPAIITPIGALKMTYLIMPVQIRN
ncbi:DNA polymerase III, beta subunit [Thalassoporum mexicanum PCC 7367]|uniref:DNA polymerase III subunit beta n=1 Tax=Thalassoporum mexicanum TaxID=3457544 RepID=UPI0002A000DD|nr:DNA polymerase III subunit beta [Pseudanabaena sp. PCC 7367]AFY69755.1 DNA polymerase III, beta subunit [Pseudanabaena sp. PCC 7367]